MLSMLRLSSPPSAATRRSSRRRWTASIVGVAALLAFVAPVAAQDPWALPDTQPVADETFAAGLGGWSVRYWNGAASSWQASPGSQAPSCVPSGTWDQHASETGAVAGVDSVLVLDDSLTGNADDWTNLRLEVDFWTDTRSRVGVLIGGSGGDLPGTTISDGYVFMITNIPTAADAEDNFARSRYRLFRRSSGGEREVSAAPITLDPTTPGLETVAEGCYRLRVEFFCGNYRVQVRALAGSTWFTLVEWTDAEPVRLTPGFVGLLHGGNDPVTAATARFDNVAVGSWGTDCAQICAEWPTTWNEFNREPVELKFLYEGALLDYSYASTIGRNPPKVDVATEPPAEAGGDRLTAGTGYCNGWQLLVDLPPPVGSGDNLPAVRAFLEPSHTAVQYADQGDGTFLWVDSYDQDTTSATYNPVPMVADGATPIANTLYDAYQWFVDKRTDGPWSLDPLAQCRPWYVFLITDGEESCATSDPDVDPVLDLVCEPGEAAELFASVLNPAASSPGIPVFTIGFAEGVSADSPLQCIAAASEKNQFRTAANAESLQEELLAIFDLLDSRSRSFVPFKISPPPSSSGAGTRELDFLTVFPFFTPRNNSSVWDGDLFAFRLNEANPTLPATDDCQIDFSQVVWEASVSLGSQFAAGYSRQVFFAEPSVGGWSRHELVEVTTDAALGAAFAARLDLDGVVQPATIQEIVNFVRNELRTDLSDEVGPARPSGTAVLGDIYHSQPIFVGPPNNPAFYYDYGFAQTGAASYRLFANKHAQRRRVVLAGANDGLLHAFDSGYYDRNLQGQLLDPPLPLYEDEHDLGNGKELFTFLPTGVVNRLFGLTYGRTSDAHQYMVDGKIVVSDFLWDHDANVSTAALWRTAGLVTLRRGGRSLVGLDLTQPDPVTGFDASDPTSIGQVAAWQADGTTDLPGCFDGSTANCDGDYPKVLWEFVDTTDADGNGHADLGWTWSKPAIARIAIHNASTPDSPGSRFVAFFGGGHDETRSDDTLPPDGIIEDHTGLHAYGVDVATGEIVFKEVIGRMVPGSFRALDSDLDGFHDRVYFASEGSIWRIDIPGPLDSTADGTMTGSDLTRIYDFRADLPTQLFFMEPITVPALFDGLTYTWGLAIGSGDRADLGYESPDPADPQIDHFFFVLDDGTSTTRGIDDLLALSYADLPNVNSDSGPDVPASCATNALDPANGLYGWYLAFRGDEKVTFEATVIDGYINFPTFEPGLFNPDGTPFTATDPPDVCGGGAAADDGGAGVPIDPDLIPDEDAVCHAAGIGRIYKLWYECGIAGDSGYQELNDIITGQEAYTIGGNTYVGYAGSTTSAAPTLEYPLSAGYTIRNWRQN